MGEVTIKFLPWRGVGGGVTKVRPLLAKTTEVVPAAPQLEGCVRLLSLSSVKSLLMGVCCCQAGGGGVPRKNRPACCPLPFPFDLPYLHSPISSYHSEAAGQGPPLHLCKCSGHGVREG